jgi:hypothetical protein
MMRIDGAILRNDHAAALRYIDEVDRAIGGDLWHDAIHERLWVRTTSQ